MEGQSSGTKTARLLRASEYFLRNRNFEGVQKYALLAQESDPQNCRAAQLLAIAAVLDAAKTPISSNNRADWYAILKLNRYSKNSQLIKNRFTTLVFLLNPSKNKLDFAAEAFELVREAWSVLSNPSKKTQFDNELKCGSIDENFWTVCPYCYCVYEYPRVYVDCCLRCHNPNCKRGFHAVVLENPPPPEVAEKGKYFCPGFSPVGFEGGEPKGSSSWTPFVPIRAGAPKWEVKKEKSGGGESASGGETGGFIEISDDSDDYGFGSENGGTLKNVNGDKAQTEGVEKMGESSSGFGAKRVGAEGSNVAKSSMKRMKSVAKHTKKLMGKGTRISISRQNSEELDLNFDAEASKVDVGFGPGGVEGMEMVVSRGEFGTNEMEFYEGEDDIFVGLQDDGN